MKHKKVTRLLPAYLDGEADQGLKSRIERHLAGCAACRQELESLKADMKLLAPVEVPELSPYLLTRTMAEIRNPERRKVPAVAVLRRALAAAAAVVLVAGGVWAGSLLGGEIEAVSENGDSMFSVDDEPSLESMYGLIFEENGNGDNEEGL